MRREGNLIERTASWANLGRAYALALEGRRGPGRPPKNYAHLDSWLTQLGQEIRAGNVEVGRFHQFVVHDPKRRVIHAPAFRERVLHHALMLVAGPVLERQAIADSYACCPGKGMHRARARAFDFSRRFDAHLKLDIRHYFDSVSHGVLFAQLERRFKDEAFLALLWRIVDAYHTSPGRGLPIGSLVSQHMANAYLGPLDRFIKEELGVRGYVRYMDDFVLWSDSTDRLAYWRDEVERLVGERLRLSLKRPGCVGRSRDGLEFLGARITPWAIYPTRRTRRRLVRKVRAYERDFAYGRLGALDLQRRASALVSVVASMRCRQWRLRVFKQSESVA